MDHIVYLDATSKELESLLEGTKDIIVRGATGRKLPYGRVNVGDTLFFTRNNGEGIVSVKATVKDTIFTDKMTKEESIELYDRYSNRIQLDSKASKRFRGKRYLCIITINGVEQVTPFEFDKRNFTNMDDWLPVEDIALVRKGR